MSQMHIHQGHFPGSGKDGLGPQFRPIPVTDKFHQPHQPTGTGPGPDGLGSQAPVQVTSAPIQDHGSHLIYQPQADAQKSHSLLSTALLFGVSPDALLKANPQISDPAAALPLQQAVYVPLAGSDAPTQHVMKAGQSLQDVAASYQTSVTNLMALNPQVANPDMVYPGDQILAPGNAGGNLSYTVQPGDTLLSIAVANGSTIADIATANGISMLDTPAAGTQLKVPVKTDYVADSADLNPEKFQYYNNVADQYQHAARVYLLQNSTLSKAEKHELAGNDLSHEAQRDLIFGYHKTKSAADLGLSQQQYDEFLTLVHSSYQGDNASMKIRSANKKASRIGTVMDIVAIAGAVFTGGASLSLQSVATATAKHFAVKAIAKESGTLGQIAGAVLNGQIDFSTLGDAAIDIGSDLAKDYVQQKLAEEGGLLGEMAGQVLFNDGNLEAIFDGEMPDIAGSAKQVVIEEIAEELGINPGLVANAWDAFADPDVGFEEAVKTTVLPVLKDLAVDEIAEELGLDPASVDAVVDAVVSGDSAAVSAALKDAVIPALREAAVEELAEKLGLPPALVDRLVAEVLGPAGADDPTPGSANQPGGVPAPLTAPWPNSGPNSGPDLQTQVLDHLKELAVEKLANELGVPASMVEQFLDLLTQSGEFDPRTPPFNPTATETIDNGQFLYQAGTHPWVLQATAA